LILFYPFLVHNVSQRKAHGFILLLLILFAPTLKGAKLLILFAPTRSKGSKITDYVCPDPKGSKISLCVFWRLFVRSMVFFLPLGLGKEKNKQGLFFFNLCM
jgi:hypothetical protein